MRAPSLSQCLVSVAAAAMIGVPAAALASGGGGGGGGFSGMPSAAAPQYDPVQEYRNGVADLQAGKFKDARRDFDHVLDVAPKNPDALFMMGLAQTGAGDLKGAARSYERSLKADPNRIPASRELAITDAKLGQADKAQAQLSALQARDAACAGGCPEAADLKAAIAAVQAALAPAASPAASGASVAPASLLLDDPAHGDRSYVRAVRLINEGRYQEALAALREAQAVFGPHPDVLTYTGYTYRKLRQYDQAISYYKQALAIAPNHVGATEYYGELMVEQGDVAGARRMLARLETICSFGCVETEDLRRWIESPQSHRS